jgi:hypothetical protein
MPPRNRFHTEAYDCLHFTSGIYTIDSTYIPSGTVAFLAPRDGMNIHLRAGTPIAQVVLLDDNGLVDEASVVPMNNNMKHEKSVSDIKQKVNQQLYYEEQWDPVGRARDVSDRNEL